MEDARYQHHVLKEGAGQLKVLEQSLAGIGFSKKRGTNDNGIRSFFKRNIWIIIPLATTTWVITSRLMANNCRNSTKNILVINSGWDQKDHAHEWMLFGKNLSTLLSIDEIALSNGELLGLKVSNMNF